MVQTEGLRKKKYACQMLGLSTKHRMWIVTCCEHHCLHVSHSQPREQNACASRVSSVRPLIFENLSLSNVDSVRVLRLCCFVVFVSLSCLFFECECSRLFCSNAFSSLSIDLHTKQIHSGFVSCVDIL